MKLRYQCPRCETPQSLDLAPTSTSIGCTGCDWQRPLHSEGIDVEHPAACLVCGNVDLWRQKDFPQSIGLTMVAAGAIFSSIAWYFHQPVWALGILLSFAAIDLLLFALMPDVLVCYRCRARHSGINLADHPTFNHETAERYRQEQLRLQDAVPARRSQFS
ncbi:MAG: hypothetical protein KF861_21105 [Planctomycetaceae bacterium]|nr:hypothetical protein [Planctomycetaceae bacterium]